MTKKKTEELTAESHNVRPIQFWFFKRLVEKYNEEMKKQGKPTVEVTAKEGER